METAAPRGPQPLFFCLTGSAVARGAPILRKSTLMSQRLAKRILLLGWDAADWKIVSPLVDAGQLPAFASLVERGCVGNIATLQPPLSPMLWTSIVTGKRAHKHGIFGFVEP